MRFWQKIFLISLTVLTVAVNIIAYMLLGNNHQLNIKKESDSAKEMYSIVVSSFQTQVIYERYRSSGTEFGSDQISQLAREFSYQFSLDNLYLFLSDHTGIRLFSNFDQDVPQELMDRLSEQKDGCMLIQNNEDNGRVYLYLASPVVIQSDTYFFITIKDITDIYDVRNEQLFFFSVVGPIASVVVALIMLIVSRLLTQQIHRLRKSTKRVAQGEYQSIPIRSSDEIGMLTEDFNKMTSAIHQKVEQLEQVAEARKCFIDNMTHEMKTPLTSIIGFSDLLCNARLDDDTVHDYAESIYKEGQYLKAVSSKLMEIILLGQKPEFSRISLPNLFAEITAAVEPIAKNRKVAFTSSSIPCTLYADRELIKSLLYNLIDNAIKASPPGKTVTLSAHLTKEGRIRMLVKDFGAGIPESEQKKIFEPFYRVDKARSRQAGGAGLGLALCAEIANVHQAKLSIESVPQQGTTIRILFPQEREALP